MSSSSTRPCLDNHPLLHQVRQLSPAAPIVVATPHTSRRFEHADFVISSHDPQALLDLLAQQFHVPKIPADPED